MTYPKPEEMSTPEIEAVFHFHGFHEFPDLDNEEARRMGELLIEWSKR